MSKQLFVDPNVIRKPGQVTFEPIPCNQYQKKVKDELGNFTPRNSSSTSTAICWCCVSSKR